MRILFGLFGLVFASCCALAEDITTRDGETFRDVTILSQDLASVEIRHSSGIARVQKMNLPEAMQKQIGFDPAKEEERLKQEKAAQEEAQRKVAEAKAKAKADRVKQEEKAKADAAVEAKEQEERAKVRAEQDKKKGQDAYYACRRYVQDGLKSPSSAKFSNPITDKDTGWTLLNPGEFRCFGTVEAVNEFNARLRQRWSVIVLE